MKERAWPVLKRTWQGWSRHDGFLLSAAMAYYAAFSLFPLCLVLIAGLGLASRLSIEVQNEQQKLLALIGQNVSPWLAEQLGHILVGVQVQAGVGGPLGLVALLLAAIGIFWQFQNIFDRVWDTGDSGWKGWWAAIRTALFTRLVAFLMLLSVGALLVTVFLADMALSAVQIFVERLPAGRLVWHIGHPASIVASYSLLVALLYKVLPRVRVRWRDALCGGIFVAVIWKIGQEILARLIIGQQYSAYGVVGSFLAIMLWIYYASAVVFLGAEFVQAIGQSDADNRQ